MKRERKEREKERKREEKRREKERKSRRKVGANGEVVDEEAEKQAEEHLRSYRHEKAAAGWSAMYRFFDATTRRTVSYVVQLLLGSFTFH